MTKQTTTTIINTTELNALAKSFDDAACKKMIGSTIKSIKVTRTNIQKTAVALLINCYKTGDLNLINGLIDEMRALNATNTNSLTAWFELLGLTFSKEDKKFIKRNSKVIELAFAGKLVKMVNNKEETIQPNVFTWWLAKVEPPFKGFDIKAVLERAVKQHDSATDKINKMEDGDDKQAALEMMAATPEQMKLVAQLIANL